MSRTVKSTSPPSRAVRKRERTRQSILEAARGLCAAGGSANLTVAGIADAADVGVGTFYYHFQTKEDVLVALMEEFLGRMVDRLRVIRGEVTDVRERLRAGYRAFFTMTPEERELHRMYFSSAGARAAFAEEARQFFLNDTIDLIEQGQAAGLFRSGPPELLANWMIGATSESLRWLLTRDEALLPAAAETLADLALTGLTRPTDTEA